MVNKYDGGFALSKKEAEQVNYVNTLERKLAIAMECIDIYADESNYGTGNYTWLVRNGWKKAKEAKKTIEELK